MPKERVTAKKIERFFIQNRRRHRRNIDQTDYDVVLVFDASNSIRKRDFPKGIKALETLIDKANPNTHYAAIVYSDKATVAFNFTDLKTAKRNLYTKVRFIGDKTNTQDAFLKCRTELFQNKNSNLRPRAKKRVLLLTDGTSNMHIHLTLYRAFQLKILGVEIFVIGVGNYMPGIQELVGIASSTNRHLYRVRDALSLLDIARLIPPWKYMHQHQLPWVMNRYSHGYNVISPDGDDISNWFKHREFTTTHVFVYMWNKAYSQITQMLCVRLRSSHSIPLHLIEWTLHLKL